MRTHKWSALEKKISPERLARVQAKVDEEISAINIRRLREALGKTQVEAAAKADMTQSEISRLERASDIRFSTLRRYVKAMGGEIEVIAVVNGKRIALHGM